MGQIIFVLLVIGGLGFFFYRQMSAGAAHPESGVAHEGKAESVTDDTTGAAADTGAADTLDSQIITLVSRTPGILQTEIYTQFPDESRKNLQAVLLQMDKDGALRREREGSSYRLFVA